MRRGKNEVGGEEKKEEGMGEEEEEKMHPGSNGESILGKKKCSPGSNAAE